MTLDTKIVFELPKPISITKIAVTEQYMQSEKYSNLAGSLRTKGDQHGILTHDMLRIISREGTPEGILAEFETPKVFTETETIPLNEKILFLYKISDPGNLGTLARTARAFNWNHIVLVDECVDPFNPECIRASIGSILKTKVYRVQSKDLQEFMKRNSVQCYIADTRKGGSVIKAMKKDSSIGLLLGSEANGFKDFPTSLFNSCEGVSLKMDSETESLNVAICGGILMYNLIKTK